MVADPYRQASGESGSIASNWQLLLHDRALMLNNPPPSTVGLDPTPWMHGDFGRSLVLLIDDDTSKKEDTALLRAFGHRTSARVYSSTSTEPATWQLGQPNQGRDFLPIILSAGEEERVLAAPAHASRERLARQMSAEVSFSQGDVSRLLALSGLVRTNRRIDGIVVAPRVLAQKPLMRTLSPWCYTPSEAVALLGLVLRANGDYVVQRDDNTTYWISGEAFYGAVAHRHLWTLEPWIRTAAAYWMQSSHEPLTRLDGIVRRLSRALRARDYLQVRLRAPQFSYVWDEVMFFLDIVLVQLMGAFDVLARFLNDLYGIENHGAISWRRRDPRGWLTALERSEPRLGFYARPPQPLGDVIDAIAVMRNLIHDAPLSDEIHDWDGSPGTLVFGPGVIALQSGRESDTLLRAVRRQGGLLAWGFSDRHEEKAVLLDPGLFAEHALRQGTKAIAEALGSQTALSSATTRALTFRNGCRLRRIKPTPPSCTGFNKVGYGRNG
jgi:hypothetical protein